MNLPPEFLALDPAVQITVVISFTVGFLVAIYLLFI